MPRRKTQQQHNKKTHKGDRDRGDRRVLPRFALAASRQAPRGVQTGVRVGFPANRTVTLPYVARIGLSQTGGAINSNQFRLNSAYDPDLTLTGHQPLGFDQWATFYNHYVVEHVDWEMEVVPYAGTIPELIECGVQISDDTTVGTTVDTLIEQGSQFVARPKYANSAAICRGSISMSKFFNRKGDIANDSSLRASTSANPTEQAIATAWAACPGSETCTLLLYFKMNMRVKFFEPTDLPPSAYTREALRDDKRKGPAAADDEEVVRLHPGQLGDLRDVQGQYVWLPRAPEASGSGAAGPSRPPPYRSAN